METEKRIIDGANEGYYLFYIPKVNGNELIARIGKNTEKALLLVDLFQTTDSNVLLALRERWVAKSIIKRQTRFHGSILQTREFVTTGYTRNTYELI